MENAKRFFKPTGLGVVLTFIFMVLFLSPLINTMLGLYYLFPNMFPRYNPLIFFIPFPLISYLVASFFDYFINDRAVKGLITVFLAAISAKTYFGKTMLYTILFIFSSPLYHLKVPSYIIRNGPPIAFILVILIFLVYNKRLIKDLKKSSVMEFLKPNWKKLILALLLFSVCSIFIPDEYESKFAQPYGSPLAFMIKYPVGAQNYPILPVHGKSPEYIFQSSFNLVLDLAFWYVFLSAIILIYKEHKQKKTKPPTKVIN